MFLLLVLMAPRASLQGHYNPLVRQTQRAFAKNGKTLRKTAFLPKGASPLSGRRLISNRIITNMFTFSKKFGKPLDESPFFRYNDRQ
jgi:hypothetical protein